MRNIKLYADQNQKNNMKLFFKYLGFTILLMGMVSLYVDLLTGWAYIGIGLVYFIFYFYEFSEVKYLLNHKRIRTNFPLGNSIKVNQIKLVKVFAEDVIFISENNVFRIDTHLIDEESLHVLEQFVEDLELEIDILPSKNTID